MTDVFSFEAQWYLMVIIFLSLFSSTSGLNSFHDASSSTLSVSNNQIQILLSSDGIIGVAFVHYQKNMNHHHFMVCVINSEIYYSFQFSFM